MAGEAEELKKSKYRNIPKFKRITGSFVIHPDDKKNMREWLRNLPPPTTTEEVRENDEQLLEQLKRHQPSRNENKVIVDSDPMLVVYGFILGLAIGVLI